MIDKKQIFMSICGLLLTTILMTYGLVFAAQQSLEKQLLVQIDTLSKRLETFSTSYLNLDEMIDHFITKQGDEPLIMQHSATLLPLVDSTQIDFFAANSSQSQHATHIQWQMDNRQLELFVQFTHTKNSVAILLHSLAISLFWGALITWLVRKNNQCPKSTTENTHFINHLLNFGVDSELAARLVNNNKIQALGDESLAWFVWAYNKTGCEARAFNVATAGDELLFDLPNFVVLIRGLPVTLPKTPFFYFYWYAKRKVEGQAPYTNPAVNKPDRVAGSELASIMATSNGTDRIIEDLCDIGMRSKSLDLNRNKVKERLVSELGDLAHIYLFESQRNPRVARYQYQLAIAHDKIKFTT
ncbi:hypothetical protein RCJ22_25290 [Vibrio sp. FNV 38]|nr:hypothetical protein [Vibrio sp. FNV 38]